MGLRSISWIVAVGMVISLAQIRSGQTQAEDPDAALPSAANSPTPPPDVIALLVEQLDAPRFADREAASEKLAALGRSTIPALSKAAGERERGGIRARDRSPAEVPRLQRSGDE